MVDEGTRKVTVSLPGKLVSYADRLARDQGSTRSAVISRLLEEKRAREREELAREGYAYYGREAAEFAAASGVAVTEALEDDRPPR